MNEGHRPTYHTEQKKTQFRALSLKLEGKCFYNICIHKISNAMPRKCLTLTKGIHLTIFGQCNRKLSSTSNLLNSNSTQNINFLQNKRCKTHFKKEKKILLNLPIGMYKLKNYLPIKALIVKYLLPLKLTTPNCYFPTLFCKLPEFRGGSMQGHLAKPPEPH